MHLFKRIILPLFCFFNIFCTHSDTITSHLQNTSRDYQPFVTYENICYAQADSAEQKTDIFLPLLNDTPAGIVIVVHGGGWVAGDKQDFRGTGLDSFFTAHHLAMVNINYRLAAQYHYPAALDDIDSVIQLLVNNAAKWHIDPSRICLFGRSSGAHLALQYAYTRNNNNRIKVVVDMFGPSDLTASDVLNNSLGINAAEMLGAYDSNRWAWINASPIFHLDKAVPTIIMHGTIDSVVYTSQSIRLADSLLSKGLPCIYIPWVGNGHGWNQGRWNENKDVALAYIMRYL